MATEIPQTVKALRKAVALSQQKLANVLGVSLSTVQAWESGRFKPSPAMMIELYGIARDAKQDDIAYVFVRGGQPLYIAQSAESRVLSMLPEFGSYIQTVDYNVMQARANPTLTESERNAYLDKALSILKSERVFLDRLLAELMPPAQP
jgi:transcriptional regulator with XRE-family HTH domain